MYLYLNRLIAENCSSAMVLGHAHAKQTKNSSCSATNIRGK